MLNTKFTLCLSLLLLSFSAHAADDGLGQTIQIHTRFHSFVGKPSWLIIIRDVDNGQNIPYVFDVKRGENVWVALTYSRNYMITVSNLQFSPYHVYPNRENPYTSTKINNFCNLESHGHIIRGESLYITLEGNLTPYNTYECHVSSYRDTNFTIASPSTQ